MSVKTISVIWASNATIGRGIDGQTITVERGDPPYIAEVRIEAAICAAVGTTGYLATCVNQKVGTFEIRRLNGKPLAVVKLV